MKEKNQLSACHRHDLTEAQWNRIKDLLPGQVGGHGRVAKDNRAFVNAVLWILRTGAPWRDLPPSMGGWKNTHRRFTRWRDKGIWEMLFRALCADAKLRFVAIDGSYVKAHPHASGARGGSEGIALTKGGATQNFTLPSMPPESPCASC